MHVALVNTNRIKPPIGPIGLEYVAEALKAAGHEIGILDLCWEESPTEAIDDFFSNSDYGLICVTLRNTDDSAMTSHQSFLGDFAGIVKEIRRHSEGTVIVGGVGFSIMPERVLRLCDADAGIWGDGEFAAIEIANRIEGKQSWHDVPNLIRKDGDGYRRNAPANMSLIDLPPMKRNLVDNQRYFREGGQAGFETKRGCPCQCVYCADPLAKGKTIRVRPVEAIADEIEALLDQGIDHLHTCDTEFNIPGPHAAEVCREIDGRKLGEKLRWYAYCSPIPFSPELAELMRRAGCVGINFGVDNGDERMLKRLNRNFGPTDILNAAHWCRQAGIATMFDLLLGSPGESKESLTRTIELMRQADPDRVGVAVGVRVYAGTPLAAVVEQDDMRKGLIRTDEPSAPLFFVEPDVANNASALLDKLIGNDERFLFFDQSRGDSNYNYNANEVLVEAIRNGHRGAYWHILAQCQ